MDSLKDWNLMDRDFLPVSCLAKGPKGFSESQRFWYVHYRKEESESSVAC
jgi:hypothetical protein